MVELWGLLILGFFAVALGYVWLTHVVDAAIDSATAEHEERLNRIEERLDSLEATIEGGDE